MRAHALANVAFVVSLVLLATRSSTSVAEESPAAPGSAVVSELQSALLEVMKQGSRLDVQQRYERLEPVVTRTHDFDYVTPRVFGDGWPALTDAQKQTVKDLYRRASIMSFAREFNEFHGEQFKVLDEKPAARGNHVVRSEMQVPGSPTVHFDYLLHDTGGEWRIINTVYDGVSGLSMDRSRYAPLLAQRGADALIAQLRQAGEPMAASKE